MPERHDSRSSLRILFVIYDFVPIGVAQIVRWANLLYYMAEAGHQIDIIAAEYETCQRAQDVSLAQLVEHPSITMHRVIDTNCQYGQAQALKWVRRAYLQTAELARQKPFDVVISSALPVWTHMIPSWLVARGHARHWIADYGDPWSTSKTLGQAAWRKPIYMQLERIILKQASALTVTTPTAIDSFKPVYDRWDRIEVIPMGASYFHLKASWTNHTERQSDTLQVLYTGSFYSHRRPDTLFQGFKKAEGVNLTIVGSHFIDIEAELDRYEVRDQVELGGYRNQAEIVQLQDQYDVLLLTSWPVPEQISGKFYEYLATNKPILYITDHERDIASDYIQEHNIGYIARNEPQAIADMLMHIRDEARAGRLKTRLPSTDVGFDQRAEAYIELIRRVIA